MSEISNTEDAEHFDHRPHTDLADTGKSDHDPSLTRGGLTTESAKVLPETLALDSSHQPREPNQPDSGDTDGQRYRDSLSQAPRTHQMPSDTQEPSLSSKGRVESNDTVWPSAPSSDGNPVADKKDESRRSGRAPTRSRGKRSRRNLKLTQDVILTSVVVIVIAIATGLLDYRQAQRAEDSTDERYVALDAAENTRSDNELQAQRTEAAAAILNSRIDLTGIDLSDRNLAGMYVIDRILIDASLKDSDLDDADLRGTILVGADLTGATLTGTRLDGVIWGSSTSWPAEWSKSVQAVSKILDVSRSEAVTDRYGPSVQDGLLSRMFGGEALFEVVLDKSASRLVGGGYTPGRYPYREGENELTQPLPPQPVFNSIIDNSDYGNEHLFYDLKVNCEGNRWLPGAEVRPGDEVCGRVLIHNAAAKDSPISVAEGTRFKLLIPCATEPNLRSIAYITSNNTVPGTVTSAVDLWSKELFHLELDPGSVELRSWNGHSRVPIQQSILTREGDGSGALVGEDGRLDGRVGPRNDPLLVTFKIRVTDDSSTCDD